MNRKNVDQSAASARDLSDPAYWLALWRSPGIGAVTFGQLLSAHPRIGEVFHLPAGELTRLGLSESQIAALRDPDWAAVEADLRWLDEADDHHLVRHCDSCYPPQLRDIPDAPPVLFVQGEPALLPLPQLAIVGSRNPSRGGVDNAYEFARHLAEAGLPITSGLALGVDAAAHRGALAGNGVTLAVIGTGPDRVYPASHRELAHQISEQGAIVSEFPPGTGARAENFPRRNRIISGLSLGTLVVEASLRSGSLITARCALEQGREVFAIPGSIHNPLSKGCHALIRQGAKLVETAQDILEELPVPATVELPANSDDENPSAAPELDDDYRRVLEALGHDPVPLDVILQRVGLTAAEVSSILLILELRGQVTALPGGRYARLDREPR